MKTIKIKTISKEANKSNPSAMRGFYKVALFPIAGIVWTLNAIKVSGEIADVKIGKPIDLDKVKNHPKSIALEWAEEDIEEYTKQLKKINKKIKKGGLKKSKLRELKEERDELKYKIKQAHKIKNKYSKYA